MLGLAQQKRGQRFTEPLAPGFRWPAVPCEERARLPRKITCGPRVWPAHGPQDRVWVFAGVMVLASEAHARRSLLPFPIPRARVYLADVRAGHVSFADEGAPFLTLTGYLGAVLDVIDGTGSTRAVSVSARAVLAELPDAGRRAAALRRRGRAVVVVLDRPAGCGTAPPAGQHRGPAGGAGGGGVLSRMPRRPAISRGEMTRCVHPVEAVQDEFKSVVWHASRLPSVS